MFGAVLAVILATRDESALIEHALRFQSVAVSAGSDRIEPQLVEQGRRTEFRADGRFEIHSFGETMRLDPIKKRIRFYSGGSGYNIDYDRSRRMVEVKPTLSRERVETLCNLYIKAAWLECEGLKFRKVEVDDRNIVLVEAVFVERGVPFAMHPVIMELDPLYGRLLLFMCVFPPEAPANLVPRLSLAEARTLAFERLATSHGSTILQEVEEFELAIVEPESLTKGRDDWFTPDQLAAGAAGKGILTYCGFFEDREVFRNDGTGGWHRFRVVLDAETGRVLALWHLRPVSGGAQSVDPAFGWNLGPEPLRLTMNGREAGPMARSCAYPRPGSFAHRVASSSNGRGCAFSRSSTRARACCAR